jgi:hypothetical protein
MTHRATLGFDRKLDLPWLDAAAAAAARGEPPAVAREYLYGLLAGLIAGDGPHSGRGKTITVLARVWLNPSPHADGLRARALGLLDAATPAERLAIHWAMCAATHPFFVDTAAAAGRLLKVQGNASLSQVVRRVAEKWGDRSTLQRAIQRVCRSYVAWGVLQEGSTRGVYEPARVRLAIRSTVGRLLIEALLLGGGRVSLPLAELVRHPALFPFDVEVRGGEMRTSPEFRVDRQGLDVDVVTLARVKPKRKAAQQITLDFETKE